jgi:hypothetical protein
MAEQASKSLFTWRTYLQTGNRTSSETTHSNYPKHTTLTESALVFMGAYFQTQRFCYSVENFVQANYFAKAENSNGKVFAQAKGCTSEKLILTEHTTP